MIILDLTCTGNSDRDRDILSTGAVNIIITLLVSLPVGVVIGLTLKAVRRCGQGVRKRRRWENREGEKEGDIYEEPDKIMTVITLSENEAYGQRN